MRLSEQESENFLSKGRILRVASIGADGEPHIAPIAYLYENGKFYISTGPKSQKARNIQTHTKVAFSVDIGEGFSDFKAVVGKGTARILADEKFADEVGKRILLKYFGDLSGPPAKYLASMKHVVIEITPTTKTSWDYSKRDG